MLCYNSITVYSRLTREYYNAIYLTLQSLPDTQICQRQAEVSQVEWLMLLVAVILPSISDSISDCV